MRLPIRLRAGIPVKREAACRPVAAFRLPLPGKRRSPMFAGVRRASPVSTCGRYFVPSTQASGCDGTPLRWMTTDAKPASVMRRASVSGRYASYGARSMSRTVSAAMPRF